MGDECEGRRQLFEHSRMEAVTSASTGSKHGGQQKLLEEEGQRERRSGGFNCLGFKPA